MVVWLLEGKSIATVSVHYSATVRGSFIVEMVRWAAGCSSWVMVLHEGLGFGLCHWQKWRSAVTAVSASLVSRHSHVAELVHRLNSSWSLWAMTEMGNRLIGTRGRGHHIHLMKT